MVGPPVGLMDGWAVQRPLSPTYAVVQHLLHDKWCAPPSQSDAGGGGGGGRGNGVAVAAAADVAADAGCSDWW